MVGALETLLALAAAGAGRFAEAPGLECRLSAPASIVAGQAVRLRFVLRNRSARPVSVLTWYTPLEGLLGDIVAIRPVAGGDRLPYRGPLVKRGDPASDDYVSIAPRDEVSEEVDLAAAYDLSRPGRYAVTFPGPLLDVTAPAEAPRPRDRHRAVRVSCAALKIQVLPPGSR